LTIVDCRLLIVDFRLKIDDQGGTDSPHCLFDQQWAISNRQSRLTSEQLTPALVQSTIGNRQSGIGNRKSAII
jgi:hypothetical protein